MSSGKPRFDPTAYAEMQKRKIEHAKEMRELRSSMFTPVNLSLVVSGKRRAASEAGSVNGGSVASSRGASPTRSFSVPKNAVKSTSGMKKSSSLSNLSGADSKPVSLKSKSSVQSSTNQVSNAKTNKTAVKSKSSLSRGTTSSPSPSSFTPTAVERTEKSPHRLKPMLEDEPYSEPIVQSQRNVKLESKSKEQIKESSPKKSSIFHSIKNSFKFFKKSSKSKEKDDEFELKEAVSAPSSLKNFNRKDNYSDGHSSKRTVVLDKPKSQELGFSASGGEGLVSKSGTDLRRQTKGTGSEKTKEAAVAQHDQVKPLSKQASKGIKDSKTAVEKSISAKAGEDAIKKTQKTVEKKNREVKTLQAYMDSTHVKCNECGRTFRPESLEKHTSICKKVFGTKRKTFDSSKVRKKAIEELNAVDSNKR